LQLQLLQSGIRIEIAESARNPTLCHFLGRELSAAS
jgi:hypothetical protein